MSSSAIQTTNFSVLTRKTTASIELYRFSALLVWFLIVGGVVNAQTEQTADHEVVISGVVENIVIGTGDTIRITGTVKQGAIAFGSDVIVEGAVEGDVAAIGGSVIQRAGAKISGDVIVIGGTYQHADSVPQRNSAAMTMMVAGYQQELRSILRTPSQLLRPNWSPGYMGSRLLSILFWFIVSLALTAALPGAISRGVTRLQLTSLRVALIGFVGSVVIAVGVDACLWVLPEPVSVFVLIMGLLLMLLAFLFGRVILAAATGKWLQRKYIPVGKHSESVALLLGTAFWVVLTSLPYVWPFVVAMMLVISFGLAFTARYRVGWRA
jgi:Integral membrane protein CcmA involved in cell shape determination